MLRLGSADSLARMTAEHSTSAVNLKPDVRREVITVDESKRRLDVRLLLGVVAAVLVATVIWAGAAMAAGGSSSDDSATTSSRASSTVQQDGQAPSGDCPNRSGSGSESSEADT
jgi:hypothetical protein